MRSHRITTFVLLFVIIVQAAAISAPAYSLALGSDSAARSVEDTFKSRVEPAQVDLFHTDSALELHSSHGKLGNSSATYRISPVNVLNFEGKLPTTTTLPGNENWADGFNLPGINREVMALAVDPDGNLYAGGAISSAGNLQTSGIAHWNGSTWATLGTGTNNTVNALAIDLTGVVYAGGDFTTAGGVSVNYIAKWDGSAWWALGSGLSGATTYQVVRALAVDELGNLYVGGNFTSAGGVPVSYIAKWDGSVWSSVGLGMNGVVRALAFDEEGNLYAGGDFTTAGGSPADHVARWDGFAWSSVGAGTNGAVMALALDADGNLYAGGGFTTAGGSPAAYIAMWNGAVWSSFGDGLMSSATAVAVDSTGVVYAGGWFWSAAFPSIGRWDGTAWLPLGTGLNSHFFQTGQYKGLNVLAIDQANRLYAGGSFTIAGGVAAQGVARWEGSSWSAVGNGNGVSGTGYTALVDQNMDLIAGGDFDTVGGVVANGIAKWNDSGWTAMRPFPAEGSLIDTCLAVVESNSGNLYAARRSFNIYVGTPSFVERWNSSSWSAVGQTSIYGTVYSLVADQDGNLYAGGAFASMNGVTASNIAMWDGASWSALGEGLSGTGYPIAKALTLDYEGNLYAAGTFTMAGGVPVNNIAKWDGVTWSDVDGGLSGGSSPSATALIIDENGNLYVGGAFTMAGSVPVSGVAKWNGASWSDLGGGVSGGSRPIVNALAFDQAGSLYAGGSFPSVGGIPASAIARWDGQAWTALGTGIAGSVAALSVDPAGNLYVVGGFNSAGDRVASRVARWTAATAQRDLVAGGSYTFYPDNLPVTVHITDLGTMDSMVIQRFDRSHPDATLALETGYYWNIQATDSIGNPAVDYTVDLTLPTPFTPDGYDQVCRRADATWDCAADSFDPVGRTITRFNVTELSDWTVKNRCGLVADFDDSGIVDVDDLIAIGNRWLWTSTVPGWDPMFDLHSDNRIDIVDIQLAAAQWNRVCQ